MVKEMLLKALQFILITHNKRMMEMVDTLYGVTMQEPGVSKLVSGAAVGAHEGAAAAVAARTRGGGAGRRRAR